MKAINFAKKHGFKPMLMSDEKSRYSIASCSINGVSAHAYQHQLTLQIMVLAEDEKGDIVDLGYDFVGCKRGAACRIYKDNGAFTAARAVWSRNNAYKRGDFNLLIPALQDCGIRYPDFQDGDELPDMPDFYA